MFACRIWNSGALESGIQLKEFGILLKTGIQNPGSKWQRNPESTAWSPECKTVLDSLTWGEKLERPEGATLRCSRSRHSRPRSERSISGINRLSATQARGTCYEMAYVLIPIRKKKASYCSVAIIALSNKVFPAGGFQARHALSPVARVSRSTPASCSPENAKK